MATVHSIHVVCAVLAAARVLAWTVTDPPLTIPISKAHFDAQTEVQYYNLGMNSNHSLEDPTAPNENPVWILIRGFQPNSTKPILVDGQLPIFGDLPGQNGYSDIRRISWVQVDSTYVAESWTSLEQIAGNVSIFQTPQIFVNMALVPNDTTLQGSMPFPIRSGYYRGQKVSFVSAGVTLPILSHAFMFYKPGTSTPSGQPVVTVMPGNSNYTGFYDIQYVSVAADYVDDSIKTAADAIKLPHTSSGLIANWPIVALTDKSLNSTVSPSPGDPSLSPSPSNNSSSTTPSASTASPSAATAKSAAFIRSPSLPMLTAALALALV